MGWLNEVFPDNDQWQKFSNGVVTITENLKNSIEIGKFKVTKNVSSHVDPKKSF